VIIVTGSIQASDETFSEILRASLEHVHRSRTEPGCISHAVHRDAEDPNRLFFFEQWADRDALLAHFAVPASNEFVTTVSKLATGRPTLEIYEASTVTL
jgi:quinol monooxygenase YgiN